MKKSILICLILTYSLFSQEINHPWLDATSDYQPQHIANIAVPRGYQRLTNSRQSFGYWLHQLPLKKPNEKVMLFNGREKPNQNAHHRIIDIDVGSRDLQQCADAVIRLYAEYQYSQQQYDAIAFNFTSGDRSTYKKWIAGFRPVVKDNSVRWEQSAARDQSYGNFKQYLHSIFTYAGSYSLAREMVAVTDLSEIKTGDVFIQGGFPGHAVIVVDTAINPNTGQKIFMLAQSYMPAQDIHILKNPNNAKLNPWYELKNSGPLATPEWTFNWTDLKRFP